MGFLTEGKEREEVLRNPLAQLFAKLCLAGHLEEAIKIVLDEAKKRKQGAEEKYGNKGNEPA